MMNIEHKQLPNLVLLAVIILLVPHTPAFADKQHVNLKVPAVYETKLALRDLWVEHVFWVRNYVGATHHKDNAATEAAESEIVNNARALALTIEPFYGKEASDKLFELLAGHWGAIKSYNHAVLVGDYGRQDVSVDELTANARRISVFLSNANPYLPRDAVFSLLSAHGGHHITQINQISASEYKAEAETWAVMRKHMFVIADAITDALAKQFPKQFYARNNDGQHGTFTTRTVKTEDDHENMDLHNLWF